MNKKFKRILAAALAAITMTTAMTLNASADNIILNAILFEGSTNQSARANAINSTSLSRYLIASVYIYRQTDSTANWLTDTQLATKSKGGLVGYNGEVETENASTSPKNVKNYVRVTATLYNGSVVASGQYSSATSWPVIIRW